jgi:hypothetical protein
MKTYSASLRGQSICFAACKKESAEKGISRSAEHEEGYAPSTSQAFEKA